MPCGSYSPRHEAVFHDRRAGVGRTTECLFNTPSLVQQDETLGELRAADDLDCDVQARHRGFEPPGIGAVGGDEDDPGEQRLDLWRTRSMPPSRSWTAPSVTSTARRWLSTRMWRLRPLIFLALS